MYDVVSICNALVDIILKVSDNDLKVFGLSKGSMCLSSKEEQDDYLEKFSEVSLPVQLGGSSLNIIRALASMKQKTFFAGMVSNDGFGEQVRDQLRNLNIDSSLNICKAEGTGSCLVFVTPDGERTFSTYLGSSRLFSEDVVPVESVKKSKIFHCCGYQWDTDSQKKAMMKALKVAKESGVKISFDVADPFVVKKNKEEFVHLIKEYADLTFANREESKMLYGLNPHETANKIASYGGIAIVKLDSEGSLVQKNKEYFHIPPQKVNVVDTTGAGDMFAAGFLYGIINNKDLKTCGYLGSQIAADVITRYGATASENILEDISKNI